MDKHYSLPALLLITNQKKIIDFFDHHFAREFHLIVIHYGSEAVERLQGLMVDLIVLDNQIADTPALTLCKQIREVRGCEDTPLLLISNNLKTSFTLQALNAGASDFLREPLDETEVVERFTLALEAKQIQKKTAQVASRISIPQQTAPQALTKRTLLSEEALKEITKARNEGSLCLLLIEIDRFSALTEKWGAPPMDELLAALSKHLKSHLRPKDQLYAHGRGRYLTLLPKTSPDAAYEIAEDLRSSTSRASFATSSRTFTLTLSIGLLSISSQDPYQELGALLAKVSSTLGEESPGNRIIKIPHA